MTPEQWLSKQIKEKGVKQITVDGKAIPGTIIPCQEGKHEVIVEM